jgi:hypothetical protein
LTPLVLLSAISALQSEPTTLPEIVVEAQRLDPLLTVTVSGDVTQQAIIRSDPVGVRCGVSRYQYDAYAAPRLCWVRTPAHTSVHLRSENGGTPSSRVQWQGCTPSDDGAECVLEMPMTGAHVEATFLAQ